MNKDAKFLQWNNTQFRNSNCHGCNMFRITFHTLRALCAGLQKRASLFQTAWIRNTSYAQWIRPSSLVPIMYKKSFTSAQMLSSDFFYQVKHCLNQISGYKLMECLALPTPGQLQKLWCLPSIEVSWNRDWPLAVFPWFSPCFCCMILDLIPQLPSGNLT